MNTRFTVFLVLLMSIMWGGVSTAANTPALLSKHQLFTLQPGNHWQQTTLLDKETEIQMGRKDERAFIIVYAYNQKNINNYPGLDQFARISTEQLSKRLTSSSAIDNPVTTTIGGRPAVIYALLAQNNDANLIYFSANIEGKHAHYWVIAWCLSSDYDDIGDDLMKTLYTLRET